MQPPEASVKSVGGTDNSYSYLVLASGMQLSKQKVNGMVAVSQAHKGGCRWVERSRVTRSHSHSG